MNINHVEVASQQREWARTGEHGWTEEPRLHSLVGWHVFPGMVLPTRFDGRIEELGLGDVRVVGMPYPNPAEVGYSRPSWAIPVESIETGERGVFTTSSYYSHDCHVWAPAYMVSVSAFHAQFQAEPLYADERFSL